MDVGAVPLGQSGPQLSEDPMGFFAEQHEKETASRPSTSTSKASAFSLFEQGSRMLSEARDALSPLSKEVKSAMSSASDYLLQQASAGSVSEVSSVDRSQRAEDREWDFSGFGDSGGEASCEDIPLFTGEQKLMNLKDAYIQLSPGRLIPGTLFMTNYRMAFVPPPSHLAMLAKDNPSIYSWLNVPLASIDRVDKERKPKDARSTGITIVITCKDVRQHRITTNGGEYELDRALSTLAAYAFPNDMRHVFAFSHALKTFVGLKMSEPYDPIAEYSRQGIVDVVVPGASHESLWRISTANKDFRLCKTYPRYMVMPNGLTDDELFLVSNFRSGHRLPALSWGDKESGASMWRSSQPKAGVSGTCPQDEKFLELLAQSCVIKRDPLGNKKVVREPILHIIDCRPRASAMANRATGAGYESQTSYPYVRLEFYNIGNIHVMRESLKSVINLVLAPSPPAGDIHFSRLVEDTQWLMHLRLILKASWDCASFVRKGQPVLVHCSHGWDRTAQVCSLAQLLLDSHYRTINGFKSLVEKEWISFGHPFELRCAHGQSRTTRQDDQMAPVFLQFLDCVWQLIRIFPNFFEFNTRYLIVLADHIYSCRFTTFLFSCEFDKEKAGARTAGVDVWTYLEHNRRVMTNPLYTDPSADNSTTTHVLLPPLPQILRSITFWTDYFFRWSGYPIVAPPDQQLANELYANGVCLPVAAGAKSIDFDIPAIITSDDVYEGLLRLKSKTETIGVREGEEEALSPAARTESLTVRSAAPSPVKSSSEDSSFFI